MQLVPCYSAKALGASLRACFITQMSAQKEATPWGTYRGLQLKHDRFSRVSSTDSILGVPHDTFQLWSWLTGDDTEIINLRSY